MTAAAAEPYYGRWGGITFPLAGDFHPAEHCWTCRGEPAIREAVTDTDCWLIGQRCIVQARRLLVPVGLRDITTMEEGAA